MSIKVGIDIGSRYIKIIEGIVRKGKLYIRNAGFVENPVENFRKFNEDEIKILSGFLKDYLKKLSIKGKETICSISGEDIILHYFEIPDIPEEEIKNAVQLEALQVISTPLGDLEYDYVVFDFKGKKNILFVAYPKEKCEVFVNFLSSSGLKPVIMDIDSLAVINCYEYFNKDEKSPIFILNVGHEYTNFSIKGAGGYIFVRDIHFGGRNITQLISETYQLSIREAEDFKIKKENNHQVKNFVEQSLEEITDELNGGLRYFENKTGLRPSKILLTGGSSLLPGLKEFLEEKLKTKVELWNPFYKFDDSLPYDIKKNGIYFAPCLGLIIRSF
ncbi:MAG TPA: hypothetical protein ENG68_01500 [bacterium]|nr:hypothetical protein [bacterium]